MVALVSIAAVVLVVLFLAVFFKSRKKWIAKAVESSWRKTIESFGGAYGSCTPGGLAGPAYRATFTLDGVEMTLTQTNPQWNMPWNGIGIDVETAIPTGPDEKVIAIARDRMGPIPGIGRDLIPTPTGDPDYDRSFAVFVSGSSAKIPGAEARKMQLASPAILLVLSAGALKASINRYMGNADDVKNAALIALKIAKG